MFIYTIENKLNGKIYIGQTVANNPTRRWSQHISVSKNEKKRNKLNIIIDKAIHKYGVDNFIFTPIQHCINIDELNLCEIFWISHLRNFLGKDYVYNIQDGGKSGGHISDETKRKLSIINTGKPSPNKGKICSEETRKRISESKSGNKHPNFGKPLSDKVRENISKAQMGNKYNLGLKRSDEARKNMSEAQKKNPNKSMLGKHHTDESKKKSSESHMKLHINVENQIIIDYESNQYTQKELAIKYSVSKTTIGRIVRGRKRSS
jgi:group I intron endonuclease